MSKHNFITYSSKKGEYGIVMPMEQYNYIVYADGSIEFSDGMIKHTELASTTIDALAADFDISPATLRDIIEKDPSLKAYDDVYDALKKKYDDGELQELRSAPENLNTDDQVKETEEQSEMESMSEVYLGDVEDESDKFKHGIYQVLPPGSHNLDDRVGQVIFSSFRSLFAQDALALLGLMTNKNPVFEILDSSIQNTVQDLYSYLRQYPDTQFVFKVICDYENLVKEISAKISDSINLYSKRRAQQATSYGYTFEENDLELGLKKVKSGMLKELMQSVKQQRASMSRTLSGILFQPFLNIFSSAYITKYIKLPADTHDLAEKTKDEAADIEEKVLAPFRKNLALIFKFNQTKVPNVCPSKGKDAHDMILKSVSMVQEEFAKSEWFSELKNNPRFDFSGWDKHVTNLLSNMGEEYSRAEGSFYLDVGPELKQVIEMHVLKGYASLKKYFESRKEYALIDRSKLDETAILGKFKNEIFNLKNKYKSDINSKWAKSQPFLDSVSIVEKMARDPSRKESREKFLDSSLRGVQSIAYGIERKSTISDIERYLTDVLGYQISPESAITNRDLLENVRKMMKDVLTFGGQVMTKAGNVIDINNSKFVVVGSKNEKLYLADLDELQSTQCAEVMECPQNTEHSIVCASTGMVLRQCAIDKMVVRASRCSTCPYGLTYGKCSACVYDEYTSKIVSAGKKQNTMSVKVQKSELLDRLMGHMDLRPATDPTDPISVWDRVVKKGSDERGTVTAVNTDYSFSVAWDNGPTSVAWLPEVERLVE